MSEGSLLVEQDYSTFPAAMNRRGSWHSRQTHVHEQMQANLMIEQNKKQAARTRSQNRRCDSRDDRPVRNHAKSNQTQRSDPALGIQPDQIAGHPGKIAFRGETIFKISGDMEARNYTRIYSQPKDTDSIEKRALQSLRNFLPRYYGSSGSGDETIIELENLLHDAPSASFIDVKLGTSAMTQQKKRKSAALIAARVAKDKKLDLQTNGFCVSGFCRKNGQTGEVIEKVFKYSQAEHGIPRALWSILSTSDGQLWEEGFHEVMRQLQALLDYFKFVNEHVIRGASVFIVVCPVNRISKVKLIDLASMEPFSANGEGFTKDSRDPGLILGVTNLMTFMEYTVQQYMH